MSLETILIHRDWQVINGFVQVPNNEETDKTRVSTADALTNISGSATTRLSLGSGKHTGGKFGQQEFVRLAGLQPGQSYSTDPVDDVAGV